MSDTKRGTLYIVPTPIGNLEDITLRALRILREVGTIACEDTRVTANLLRHYEVPQKRLISYFAGNERERVAQLVGILASGEDIALVSDAGTPGISDPGARLISAAIDARLTIVPLPGPTAAIAAVVASGLPTDSILFEGFLPHKKGRQTMLRGLSDVESTIVLYESPHRIVKALNELAEHLGASRRACVAREITKMYEEINRGTLAELAEDYGKRPSIKGEFVVVIEGDRGKEKGEGKRERAERMRRNRDDDGDDNNENDHDDE
jgi:16S rRNA (cytidine1402-2'-O)-methyltransferase